MSTPSPQPALDILCGIAAEAGAHVELHVTGPRGTQAAANRRLDRIRVARKEPHAHLTLAQAAIRPGGRVAVERAAMLCLEELAKT